MAKPAPPHTPEPAPAAGLRPDSVFKIDPAVVLSADIDDNPDALRWRFEDTIREHARIARATGEELDEDTLCDDLVTATVAWVAMTFKITPAELATMGYEFARGPMGGQRLRPL